MGFGRGNDGQPYLGNWQILVWGCSVDQLGVGGCIDGEIQGKGGNKYKIADVPKNEVGGIGTS
jgi:O-acetyl-ADP-ribose deacetylase (regulator of RNase III)